MRKKILLILILAVNLIILLNLGCAAIPKENIEVKAAIIDQLSGTYPNADFISQVTEALQQAGFSVKTYSGDEITVGFYRNLPSMGYQLIIFRAHSGLLAGNTNNSGIEGKIWLFSNEPYSKDEYLLEQLSEQITYGQLSKTSERYFAIGSKFVNNMQGEFNHGVVIFMGCDSFHYSDVVQAFVSKGASACLGWNLSVGINYVDDSTIELIKYLCSDYSIKNAVANVRINKGPSEYNAVLKYYPELSGTKTMAELTR